MPTWLDLNWQEMFVPSKPVLETIIRGSATYLSLFVLLRLFRRQTGSIAPADLLVLLLIADASQNAMAGEYRSITDGLILVTTIVTWEYALDFLAFHIPVIGRVIDRPPLPLIQDGQLIHRNLKQELMTEEELLSQLREKGVDDFSAVKQSLMEGDGRISVITKEPAASQQIRPNDPTSGG
jgi:uncharacterized membrane protein YcaP (DUF421 family)